MKMPLLAKGGLAVAVLLLLTVPALAQTDRPPNPSPEFVEPLPYVNACSPGPNACYAVIESPGKGNVHAELPPGSEVQPVDPNNPGGPTTTSAASSSKASSSQSLSASVSMGGAAALAMSAGSAGTRKLDPESVRRELTRVREALGL